MTPSQYLKRTSTSCTYVHHCELQGIISNVSTVVHMYHYSKITVQHGCGLCDEISIGRPESVNDLGGQKLEAVPLPLTTDADSDTGKDSTTANFLDKLTSSAHAAEVSWRDMPSISSCSAWQTLLRLMCSRCPM